MWTCEQGLYLFNWFRCYHTRCDLYRYRVSVPVYVFVKMVCRYAGMNCMGGTVWTGSASVNEICTFELAILLRDVNHLTWCFTCKMFARLWMRHIHEKEVCTCDPVNRVRSCKTRAHLWMEMGICEGELVVENRATYLLTGHVRCEWNLIPMNGTTHVWTGPLTFWTKPVDYQFTNGGPFHTWRSIHTRRYRLHVEDHGQAIPNLWTGSLRVTGSSTRDRDMYV